MLKSNKLNLSLLHSKQICYFTVKNCLELSCPVLSSNTFALFLVFRRKLKSIAITHCSPSVAEQEKDLLPSFAKARKTASNTSNGRHARGFHENCVHKLQRLQRSSWIWNKHLKTYLLCWVSRKRRPKTKTKDLEKEDPLENEDLEKEDPLENEDLENEDPIEN